MRRELCRVQAGFEFLDQFGGTGHFNALVPHEFDGSGVDHRHIRYGAARRVLHGDALFPLQNLAQPVMLLLPTGILQFLAGHGIEHAGLDAVYDAARVAGRGNEVIPAPRDVPGRLKTEHAIRQRVALMMIEEQPAVKFFAAKSFLNSGQIHVGQIPVGQIPVGQIPAIRG